MKGMTQRQRNSIKEGDQLIFFRQGGVLSANIGNVFTFANWHNGKHYWQCKELLDLGNHVHNYSIYDVELFDSKKHTNHVIMDKDKIIAQELEFIDKYGA